MAVGHPLGCMHPLAAGDYARPRPSVCGAALPALCGTCAALLFLLPSAPNAILLSAAGVLLAFGLLSAAGRLGCCPGAAVVVRVLFVRERDCDDMPINSTCPALISTRARL